MEIIVIRLLGRKKKEKGKSKKHRKQKDREKKTLKKTRGWERAIYLSLKNTKKDIETNNKKKDGDDVSRSGENAAVEGITIRGDGRECGSGGRVALSEGWEQDGIITGGCKGWDLVAVDMRPFTEGQGGDGIINGGSNWRHAVIVNMRPLQGDRDRTRSSLGRSTAGHVAVVDMRPSTKNRNGTGSSLGVQRAGRGSGGLVALKEGWNHSWIFGGKRTVVVLEGRTGT